MVRNALPPPIVLLVMGRVLLQLVIHSLVPVDIQIMVQVYHVLELNVLRLMKEHVVLKILIVLVHGVLVVSIVVKHIVLQEN